MCGHTDLTMAQCVHSAWTPLRGGPYTNFLRWGTKFPRPTSNIFNIFEAAFHPQPEGTTRHTEHVYHQTVRTLSSSLLPQNVAMNGRIIGEDVEGSDCGVIWGTIPAFTYRNCGKPRKNLITIVGVPDEIQNQGISRTNARRSQLEPNCSVKGRGKVVPVFN